ncbi:hypothetical protein AB833_25285 [Chromatiales bacterium (ex Bugula neritina AB1)]|nr:hypothetical protein AB833_25285 [Chromatiales bacterium (ex Bugula neritina AB1)]
MTTVSRDTLVSIVLLVFCGFLIWAGFQIRDPQFGELSPAAWPKAVSYVLTGFCLIYFLQSVLADRSNTTPSTDDAQQKTGVIQLLQYYANPIICFALYFLFLYTLPYLGTLLGGIALVFALLSVLGGIQLKQLLWHMVLAVVSVGAMWSLFTYGLRVMLPRGTLFPSI